MSNENLNGDKVIAEEDGVHHITNLRQSGCLSPGDFIPELLKVYLDLLRTGEKESNKADV